MEVAHHLVNEFRLIMDPQASRGSFFMMDLLGRLAEQAVFVGGGCITHGPESL